jgi:hypothetical protein
MIGFLQMLSGAADSPGARVNACMGGDWINGAELPRAQQSDRPPQPASDNAVKIARAIEDSVGQWAFEDDQGHSHCYGLGITVSHGPKAIVWQGDRDDHVRYSEHTVLFDAEARTPDAIVILEALQRRRARYKQEQIDAKRRADEERKAAQAKRAEEAIEKLARGERLDDPFAENRCGLSGIGGVSQSNQDYNNSYAQYLGMLAGRP